MARVAVKPNNVVNVQLPASDLFSINKVQEIQKSVLGKLGCTGCCSGFIINYQLEEHEFGA